MARRFTAAMLLVLVPLNCALAAGTDGDGDGVSDARDECPYTEPGAKVDFKGCALDGDHDGVADGLDLCPKTAAGAVVDAQGCAKGQKPDKNLKVALAKARAKSKGVRQAGMPNIFDDADLAEAAEAVTAPTPTPAPAAAPVAAAAEAVEAPASVTAELIASPVTESAAAPSAGDAAPAASVASPAIVESVPSAPTVATSAPVAASSTKPTRSVPVPVGSPVVSLPLKSDHAPVTAPITATPSLAPAVPASESPSAPAATTAPAPATPKVKGKAKSKATAKVAATATEPVADAAPEDWLSPPPIPPATPVGADLPEPTGDMPHVHLSRKGQSVVTAPAPAEATSSAVVASASTTVGEAPSAPPSPPEMTAEKDVPASEVPAVPATPAAPVAVPAGDAVAAAPAAAAPAPVAAAAASVAPWLLPFSKGSSTLDALNQRALDAALVALKASFATTPEAVVELRGDALASETKDMGARRVAMTRAYLLAHGVAPARIIEKPAQKPGSASNVAVLLKLTP